MSDQTAVMAKISADGVVEYLKAHQFVSTMDEPVIGKRYLFCGMVTSPVKAFEKAGDGWRVETKNSVYLCWLDTLENAGLFAESKGLADPMTHASGAIYWGFDRRPETYIL